MISQTEFSEEEQIATQDEMEIDGTANYWSCYPTAQPQIFTAEDSNIACTAG